LKSQQQQAQQQQKKQPSFKGLMKFLREASSIKSPDAHVREQAIKQSTEDLRNAGATDAWANDFSEFMKNVEEAMVGWLRHSTLHKRIATGLLAINFLLLPFILTQQVLDIPLKMALIAIAASIPLLAFYNFTIYTFEEQKVENAGCGLVVIEIVFEVATAFGVGATLWHVFPVSTIVFLSSSLIGVLIWVVNMMRGAITAAHWRRQVSQQTDTQQMPPSSPPSEDKK